MSFAASFNRARSLVADWGARSLDIDELYTLAQRFTEPDIISYLEDHLQTRGLPSPWKMQASLCELLDGARETIERRRDGDDTAELPEPNPSAFLDGVKMLGFDLLCWFEMFDEHGHSNEKKIAPYITEHVMPLWSKGKQGVQDGPFGDCARALQIPQTLFLTPQQANYIRSTGLHVGAYLFLSIAEKKQELTWSIYANTLLYDMDFDTQSLAKALVKMQKFFVEEIQRYEAPGDDEDEDEGETQTGDIGNV